MPQEKNTTPPGKSSSYIVSVTPDLVRESRSLGEHALLRDNRGKLLGWHDIASTGYEYNEILQLDKTMPVIIFEDGGWLWFLLL